jgi:hypothetical protein
MFPAKGQQIMNIDLVAPYPNYFHPVFLAILLAISDNEMRPERNAADSHSATRDFYWR